MKFSFTLSLLGQEFAFASAPADVDEEAVFMSVLSETERSPIGFAAADPDYFEEEEERA